MERPLVLFGYLLLFTVPYNYGETTEASVANAKEPIAIVKSGTDIDVGKESSPSVNIIHVNTGVQEKAPAMDINQQFTSQKLDIKLQNDLPPIPSFDAIDISPFTSQTQPPSQLKLAPVAESVSNKEPVSLTFNDIFQIGPDRIIPPPPKFGIPIAPEVVIPTKPKVVIPKYPAETETATMQSSTVSTATSVHGTQQTNKAVTTLSQRCDSVMCLMGLKPAPIPPPPKAPFLMANRHKERIPLVTNRSAHVLNFPTYQKDEMYTPYKYKPYIKYTSNLFGPKKALYLSSRPPMYRKKNRAIVKKWVDLAKYKRGYYESLHNKKVLREAPYYGTNTLLSLLEAGSVANFEYQFRAQGSETLSSMPQPSSKYTSNLDDLMSGLDHTVNPCDDFYQFACGGFRVNSTRKNGVVNKLEEVRSHLKDTISWVLGQQSSPSDPAALSKGKQFYQSCMNTQRLDQRGLDPLRNFLSDRGGWPVLGLWDPKRFNLEDILGRTRPLVKDFSMHSRPTGTIVGMTIQRDFLTPGTHVFYFDQPSLGQVSLDGMPNNDLYKLGTSVIYNMAYEDYLVDIAVALGANPRVARRDMRDLVSFEMSLASIMVPEVSRRKVEANYKTISILEMSLRYPYFDWFRFIKQIVTSTDAKISPKLSDKVVLWSPTYFDRLGKLLKKTPRRVMANYVLFRSIKPMLLATNQLMQYVNLRYTAVISGTKTPRLEKRSDFCASLIVNQMDWLASRIFVESSLDKGDVAQVHKMKDFIKDALINRIENSAWIDVRTKKMQLLKIKLMEDRIAFPGKLLSDKLLDDYYKDFSLTDDLFENMEETLKRNYAKLLFKIHATPPNDWITRPSETRHLYNPGANAIEIPSVLIQPPFIQAQSPDGMNFGGIGTVVANSYAEAFDISGMKFDWNGALEKVWSKKSLGKYERKAKCLVHQYSSYFLPDANLFILNGEKTLNSNLRDNMALDVAYDAYKLSRINKPVNNKQQLPYTEDQLYFINYARTMCQSATPTYTRMLPYISLESVPRIRVIGPIQNSKDFSNAFNCPVGSLMNPKEKCTFW